MESRTLALFALGALVMGCYSLQPISGATPDNGIKVALEVNDAGRAALSSSMGPEIDQVEGTLLESTDRDYLVGVSQVKLLRGAVQVWSGEQVRISADHVRSISERRFSRTRTIALGGAVVGGFAAFLISRELGVFGTDSPVPIDSTGGTLTIRP